MLLEIIGRLFIAVTYLVAVIIGTIVGFYLWCVIGALLCQSIFHITPTHYLLFAGFGGAGLTCLHFVKHWEFYFQLQRLKRLHRIKYRRFSGLFVESAHTVGDIIFVLAYLIADGVVPWIFLAAILGLAAAVCNAALPPELAMIGTLVLGFLSFSFAFTLGSTMVEAVFHISNLKDELEHNVDI